MRKTLLVLLVFLIAAVAAAAVLSPSCNEQRYRMGLVKDIKAFEKKIGFSETENFTTYSDEVEAYHYCFYTSITKLPYSLDDPMLQPGIGTPESVSIDSKKYDAYFYSIPSVAGVKAPVTKSLLKAPLHRFILLIFHEDWHEQIDLPLGIEEPSAEVVSYVAAMLFAEEKFGQDSEVYSTLRRDLNNKLKETKIYEGYYGQLESLYSRFHAGTISEAETLHRKGQLLNSMGNDLQGLWGGKPDQLNNAFIAFRMTYLRYLPLMHQVFSATGSDLSKTIVIFQSMPEQGASFNNLDEVKNIEKQVTDYLILAIGP